MRRGGFSHVELIAAMVIIAVLVLVLIPVLNHARRGTNCVTCVSNLKQMGVIFNMYAAESKGGLYPTLRQRGGANCDVHLDKPEQLFGPDVSQLYPEYLIDPSVLVCPEDSDGVEVLNKSLWHCQGDADQPICPCLVSPVSYFYYSWIITPDLYLLDEADLNATDPSLPWADPAWLEAFSTRIGEITANQPADEDCYRDIYWVADEPLESGSMYRTRAGVGRFFLTPTKAGRAEMELIESKLAIMHDAPNPYPSSGGVPSAANFCHTPPGGNVLYMDGHVGFVKYPRKWPFCSSWSLVLDSLE
ncbi:MAG: hypothetical protein GY851_33280 [bacterium]|nr:hypothetical protein [bacterium]